MKNLLSTLLAVTIYLTNGDVINIERNWLVKYYGFGIYGGAYVSYTIDDAIHKVPIYNILEIVETPYQGGQQ